jgi:hypothetical protein
LALGGTSHLFMDDSSDAPDSGNLSRLFRLLSRVGEP